MCDKCKSDATSNRCIRCGKPLGKDLYRPQFVNPNFDAERFDGLSNGTTKENDEDVDYELVDKILNNQ